MLKNVSLRHYYNITASLTSYKRPWAHCNVGYQSVNFTVNISVTVGGSVTQWSAHRTRRRRFLVRVPLWTLAGLVRLGRSECTILGHFRK